MANFKVLKNNQALMAWIGIHSYNLNEPKNEFVHSITAYYFLFALTIIAVGGSAVFTLEHWPQFDIISQPLLFVFGCSGCTGLILSVGLNMKSVKALHLKLQRIIDEGTILILQKSRFQ